MKMFYVKYSKVNKLKNVKPISVGFKRLDGFICDTCGFTSSKKVGKGTHITVLNVVIK